MDFREVRNDNANIIQGHAPGAIHVNDQCHTEAVVVLRDGVWTGWLPAESTELTRHHLEPLLAEELAVVLLGTGDGLAFPDPALTAPLFERGIGVEVMATPAACRTFNLLMGEERPAAAILFPPTQD